MGAFARDWLALREPYDHMARSGRLAASFAAAIGPAPRVIDLGCGTGSNLRYLSPRLGRQQSWLCLDHDSHLLEAGARELARWGQARGLACDGPATMMRLNGNRVSLQIVFAQRDLADLKHAFGAEGAHGATASALLDLASADWLERLAHKLARRALAALFALSYDGRLEWAPALEDDRTMNARFHCHQRTDKGFGPALGPDATAALAERLRAHGYRVRTSPTDWRLDGADRPLAAAFLEGFAAAARAIESDRRVDRWLALRRRQLVAGELRIRVGHLDLLALPA